MTASPSLISDNGVIHEYDCVRDSGQLLAQLKAVCAENGVIPLVRDDLPGVSAIYSQRDKFMIVAEDIPDADIRNTIQYLRECGDAT